MKLLNVRLGPEDARMAEHLRARGIQISRIVREAIRAAFERESGAPSRRRAGDIMRDIYRKFPDPPGLVREKVDLRDRRSVRRVILKRLQRRRG